MSDEMTFLSPSVETMPQPRIYGARATIGMGVAIGIFALFAVPILVSLGFQAAELAFNTSPAGSGLIVMLSTIATGISGIWLIYRIVQLNDNRSLADYIELRQMTWKTVLLALAVLIIIFVCNTGLNIVYSYFGGDLGSSANSDFMADIFSGAGWLLALLATGVFAPVFEETFFRGFLFVGLQRSRMGVAGTIILTSLIWALAHRQYNWFGMVSIGVMGIALGITRYKTGSLWCPIIVHAMWNGLALLMTALG
jgi:membrane protease YdiL (CAAX protease family)